MPCSLLLVSAVLFGLAAGARAQLILAPPLHHVAGTILDTDNVPLLTGDFNGDGKLDLVIFGADGGSAFPREGVVLTLPGRGDGTFGAPVSSPAAVGIAPPVTGDFNGDGRLDLAVAASDSIYVLLGDGHGAFQAIRASQADPDIRTLPAGDLNGDGRPDLAACAPVDGTLEVFLNRGDGTFGPPTIHGIGGTCRDIAIADLNGDGKADLVVSDMGAPYVDVLLNRGDGSFRSAIAYPGGAGGPVRVTDFDGDGRPDLAVNDVGELGGAGILFNDAGLNLRPPVVTPIGHYPHLVAMGDFDGDGAPDFLETSVPAFDQQLFFVRGNGDGTFALPVKAIEPGGAVAAGDFDGDGRLDFAVARPDGVDVYLNRTPRPMPGPAPIPVTPSPTPGTSGRPVVSVGSSPSPVEAGSRAFVTVSVDASARDVAGIRFILHNGGAFGAPDPKDVVIGPVLTGFGAAAQIAPVTGDGFSVGARGTEGRDGGDRLIVFAVPIPADAPHGVYPLILTDVHLTDSFDAEIPVDVQDGTLAISGPITGSLGGGFPDGGKVDVKDATMALEWAVGLRAPTPAQVSAYDVNHNGRIDIGDATLLLAAAVGLRALM